MMARSSKDAFNTSCKTGGTVMYSSFSLEEFLDEGIADRLEKMMGRRESEERGEGEGEEKTEEAVRARRKVDLPAERGAKRGTKRRRSARERVSRRREAASEASIRKRSSNTPLWSASATTRPCSRATLLSRLSRTAPPNASLS